ncbi:PKD domain-containing protein [Bacteroidia bacterium]|jgi:PKD repeat protein|nr:PKD domain-containing protein [Bacteroidia bacterium]
MKKITIFMMSILTIGYFSSCNELEYPEAGSIADLTPPSASFGTTPSEENYQEINFDNFSGSATDYSWDFGNGQTSTEKNPTVTYEDGRYLVSLTASDKLGKSNIYEDSVIVVKPTSTFQPTILNPGYDDEGDDSYRNHWRNGDLGGVIQITSSPVHDGVKSAKLPSDGSRIGYQEFTVEEDVDYILEFWYTMKTTPAGTLTVAVLDGPVTDPASIPSRTIESVVLNDQTDANLYTKGTLEFNSGNSVKVAIYFNNADVESRIDTWSISIK